MDFSVFRRYRDRCVLTVQSTDIFFSFFFFFFLLVVVVVVAAAAVVVGCFCFGF